MQCLYTTQQMCACVCHHTTKSTHINPRLFLVVLLLVKVNKALPIDLELGTLWHLAYGISELLLAKALFGEEHNIMTTSINE